jgi:hypothetical protein
MAAILQIFTLLIEKYSPPYSYLHRCRHPSKSISTNYLRRIIISPLIASPLKQNLRKTIAFVPKNISILSRKLALFAQSVEPRQPGLDGAYPQRPGYDKIPQFGEALDL